jgi:hypothetical protein
MTILKWMPGLFLILRAFAVIGKRTPRAGTGKWIP